MAIFIADDGAPIAYADDGRSTPLLFLHGLNADGRLFAAQAEGLADRFRVLRPDFRGHGATPGGAAPDMARLAADVEAMLRALDLSGVVGVGWSLGAMVLWRVLLGPEARRFAGAVVVDMTAKVESGGDWRLGLIDQDMRAPAPGETRDERGLRIGRAVVAAGTEDGPVARAIAPLMAQEDVDAVGQIGASLFQEDFRDRLGAIATPTLVIHGARSRYYAAETAQWVAAALPHARVVSFEQSGHAPHAEEPGRFNQIIADFAREVGASHNTEGRIDA